MPFLFVSFSFCAPLRAQECAKVQKEYLAGAGTCVFTSGVTLVKPGIKVVPCNVGSVRFLAFADCNAN